jgi:2-(1,2-epoxy-1,2-dihydrophenyl)acetyl-CoA isomerase
MASNMSDFDPETDQLLFRRDGRVVTFTLNRPEARNALADDLTRSLRRGIKWATQEDSVGALVLTGSGSAFCAGGDVKAMAQKSSKPAPSYQSQYSEMVARHLELSGALYAMRKPTIAALPGPAAGAGMALALACDLRVAADTAFLSTAYARIGMPGDYGIAWLLTRVVGPARARELMLTSERVGAAKALDWGLVNRVSTAPELLSTTLALATTLANGPSIAFQYIKDNLDEALSLDHRAAIEREADRLLKARSTDDHREAVKAIAEKREPTFNGK